MEAAFKCQCGNTERDNTKQHPFRCETCPDCGSQILAPGETYDEPLPHVVVHRLTDQVEFDQCKRCGLIVK